MSINSEFKNRMKLMLADEYDDFIDSLGRERITALRINSLKSGEERDVNIPGTELEQGSIPWAGDGYIYTEGAPGKSPLHEAGLYYIQEPSAMAPVKYLDPQPGEKILDLCAAPGGKTAQIGALMKGEGILVSNEIDKKRAQILSLNVERMGIRNAMVTNMSADKLSVIFEGYFDRILVDAPCSGEGMFRKNDEAQDNWSAGNVRISSERQKTILDEAVKMLRPGGRLVYSTCTFAPEEDEENVLYLLRRWGFKGVSVKAEGGMKQADTAYIDMLSSSYFGDEDLIKDITDNERDEVRSCALRLFPHLLKGEGHFLAVLEKTDDNTPDAGLYNINGNVRAATADELSLFRDFAENYLTNVTFEGSAGKTLKGHGRRSDGIRLSGSLSGTPFMFGQQLYLAPLGMPGIMGIALLRPGLHLGTVKKDRFEPSHALALALYKGDVRQSFEVPSSSQEAASFIGGQSLRTSEEMKGWVLITTDGYSLGWAKCAGNILKNHYPKGLRIYN